jgi:hypothetical protein
MTIAKGPRNLDPLWAARDLKPFKLGAEWTRNVREGASTGPKIRPAASRSPRLRGSIGGLLRQLRRLKNRSSFHQFIQIAKMGTISLLNRYK